MANFDDHIRQANHNLQFLECINKNCNQHYDWQVTVCFYTALHLVNAHLATQSLQYRKHKDVKDALNPYSHSPVKLPEQEYTAYATLQSLSRRARYLVNEKDNQLRSDAAALTYEKHLGKALRHFETLAAFFRNKYKLTLRPVYINCIGFKTTEGLILPGQP